MTALADFAGMSEAQVKVKIAEDFGIDHLALDGIKIVVAYMSVGSWGCDSSAFIVFERDHVLFEVNGSHCSCHGFGSSNIGDEGDTQWRPEEVSTVAAVVGRADYSLAGGGYDDDAKANADAIRAALRAWTP